MNRDRPSARFYLPELDGLRFIAFLLVFIHNANPILQGTFLETFSEYSWFGVDLFFCLSGFLITKLLVTEYEQTGKINIRNFYIRRALRIVPLYFFYVVIGAIIIAPVEGRNVNLGWHIATLGTFTFNFAYLALLPSPILIFIHLWSISYEMQFYAVAPWFIRRMNKASSSTKIKWLLALFTLGLLIRGLFIALEFHPAAVYFLPVAHFDSLIGGIVLGLRVLDYDTKKIKPLFLWIAGIASGLFVFILPNNDATTWGLMLTYLLIGVSATLVVYLVSTQEYSLVHLWLGNPVLVYLGKISYGLYIYHFGAFTLAVIIADTNQLTYPQNLIPVLNIAFVITLMGSIFSYHIIERPTLALKNRFSPGMFRA
jgi:peptidoglycan/LPS O-acetylase OafA/YrhL